MNKPSLSEKKAYCALVRRSNYAASLHLEGYDTTPQDGQRPLKSKEEILSRYLQRRS